MINMGGTQQTATTVGVVWLCTMDFKSGMQYVSTAAVDLTIGGHVYRGLGSLADVGMLNEGPDSAAEQLVLTLALADQAMLALVLGNVEDYRGRKVTLALQLLDERHVPTGPSVPRWAGVMNPVRVVRESTDQDRPQTGRIELPCTRAGMARARHYVGLRLTLAQQQQRYPADTGLRYVRTLIEQPTLWLSKAFQKQ